MFDRQQILADPATFAGFKTVVCRPSLVSSLAVGERLDSGSLDAYYQICYETARMRVDWR